MARPTPMAGGQPISDQIADEAAAWVTLMMSPEASYADHLRLQTWRDAHTDHERAWQHIEAVSARMRTLDPAASTTLTTVATKPLAGRRRATLAMVWLGAAGVAGFAGTRTQTWQETRAQYRTAKGEQQQWVLDDGTQLILNTDSAVNVDYTDDARRIQLISGEILIETGHLAHKGLTEARPFTVHTGAGQIKALGTRFMVRQDAGRTAVVVLTHGVLVTPHTGSTPVLVGAGQQTTFDRLSVDVLQPVAPLSEAWAKGQLIAVDMRLGDFIEELARYRTGILRCDPAVADLRFSGVFPLQDTERILAMLPDSLPIQLHMRTRYWVTIAAATSGS
jgi:transmembrane sensor